MAWDKTQPTNTTTLRNLGTVIRPNWNAIETADSTFKPEAFNLLNRTPATVPIDPVAIANTVIVYCKEDSSGNPQFYAIDPSSNIYQLTGDSFTETTNGGTAGGTLNKVEQFINENTRVVTYSGKTAAFSGNATVLFPETYTTIYSHSATANDPIVQKIAAQSTTTTLTLYTENSVSVSWFAIGRIL